MSKPMFGYAGEQLPRRGRLSIKRRPGERDRWSEVLLPADTDAAVETETSRKPLIALVVVIAAASVILGLRLFALQIIDGRHNLGLANGNRIRQKITRAPRGIIYDRNNKVLVRNVASYDITVVPQLLPRSVAARQLVYQQLAGLTGATVADITSSAETKGLYYPQPLLVLGGIDRDKALLVDQQANALTGFSLDVNPIREYLDPTLSHTLGYTGRVGQADLDSGSGYIPTDYTGKTGLEQQYEQTLRGQNGSEQTEVDALGRPVKLLASRRSLPGANLQLSIDIALQHKLSDAIQKQMGLAGATQAAGVAINPKTGEILAAVSLPGYDNNLFSRGIDQANYQKLLNDAAGPLYNKVTAGAFPSGSIIKPLVATAALEEHVVTPTTTIEDKGKLELPNPYTPGVTYTFFGWEHSGLGVMNVYRALAMSSDIYFYTVAGGFERFVGLGVEKLTAWYQKFGLGSKTGVDLPEETAGRVPTPAWKKAANGEPWYTGDTYNISVGQGDILISPLQIAMATAAVANGGTLVKPHFAKTILDGEGKLVQTIPSEVSRRNIASAATLQVVREGMRQTVVSGTACCFIEKQVPVHVAGKTGTAETDPGHKNPHAWFTAFAPYEDPNIVMVVLVENAPGEGATFAAPAVRETLAWYFSPH